MSWPSLPHPNEWLQRGPYVVPCRVGRDSPDMRVMTSRTGTPPYDRCFQLMFQLDEVSGTGEILWRCDTVLATGLVWGRDGRAVPMRGPR
jgi:hypothetical protein